MPTRRDGLQCRRQWIMHENPDVLRSPFTESEVRTIIQKMLALGDVSGKWRSIAGLLEPGRHPEWCEAAWKKSMRLHLERFIAAEVDAAPSLRRAAKPSTLKMDKEALQEEALQLRMNQGETREGAERALRSARLDLIWYDILKLRKEVGRLRREVPTTTTFEIGGDLLERAVAAVMTKERLEPKPKKPRAAYGSKKKPRLESKPGKKTGTWWQEESNAASLGALVATSPAAAAAATPAPLPQARPVRRAHEDPRPLLDEDRGRDADAGCGAGEAPRAEAFATPVKTMPLSHRGALGLRYDGAPKRTYLEGRVAVRV
jgi:hypothetical protein